MGRQPCCDKIGLKRGPWTIEEDHKLISFIMNNGIQCWRMVPKLAGLLRCGKSCRLRWINYLRPDLKRGAFTEKEENQIIELHACLGNRWSKIASHFPGRTDNEMKNHWNTRIKKRLKLLALDPITHQPIEQKAEKAESDNKQNQEEKVEINAQMQEQPKADQIKEAENTSYIDQLMNNYEMMYKSTYSPSLISLEDSVSYHSLTGESTYETTSSSLQEWVDDPLFYWDGINEVDQNLLFEEIKE